MDRKRPRSSAGRLALGALVLTLPALPAHPAWAQLANATWVEGILFTTSESSDSKLGIDDTLPEPLTDSLNGPGYSMVGSVTFPSPGTPNTAVSLGVDYESGLTTIGGNVGSRIDFEFRVVQTATPPVSVATVPVHVQAQGSAHAEGDPLLRAAAFSQFTLINQVGLLVFWGVDTDNADGGAPPSDSFANEEQIDFKPGEVVSGEMIVDASIGADALGNNIAASAGAAADPLIEITDALIPGTSASFRDYFAVEFSPGYLALGQVPARSTTWGKLKRRYQQASSSRVSR